MDLFKQNSQSGKGRREATHSAAILQHSEGEAAVALSPQLHVVGALEHHCLLQVAGLLVHVGNAVLAVVGDVLAGLVGQQAHEGELGGHALGADGLIIVGKLCDTTATGRRSATTMNRDPVQGGNGEVPLSGRDTHLSATVDGLTEPHVLHGLCASEPILLGDALRLGVDASLAGGKVAEDLNSIVVAALVGVDPVESCKGKTKWFVRAEREGRGLSAGCGVAKLTAGPLGVAELDVTAGAGRVLPGSLGGEQVLDLGVEGLDGGVHLVVLGSQGRLVGSVLIISGDVVAATSRAGRSGQTRRSGGTLIGEITQCHTLCVL